MYNFKFISSNEHNPYFNIASEEYLLKQTTGYYIYLWRNSPAVIIGNNQNTLLEVNLNKATSKDIKVVRRLTGGGAVYHDLNNICYTIIAPYNSLVNSYIEFTTPIINYLNSLGVNAKFSGRNDICIDDKKISGNAQVVYKDRIMHHGTLLFDTDLSVLNEVLLEDKLKTKSKGIKSIRARVTNVKNYLPNLNCDEFFNNLCNYLKNNLEEYTFNNEDISKIEKLEYEKYRTYSWNIGNSPKGSSKIDIRLSFGTLTLTFDLVSGIISNAEIFGDYFSKDSLQNVANKLNGKKFEKEDFLIAFSDITNYIENASASEIVDKIFS